MSVELNQQQPGNVDLGVVNENALQPVNDDAELEAIWNKNERDNGAEREGGKFVSPDPDKRAADPLEGGDGEGQADASSTPEVVSVPLPANWRGKEDVWEKIPAELKGAVAGIENELQRTLSEQGRQLSTLKPVGEVIDKYGRFFAADSGYKLPDGRVPTPAEGISYLFNVQASLESDAPSTILQIIDTYGARDKVAALLGVAPGEQQGDAGLRQEIAGLKQQLNAVLNPASIDQRIDQRLQEDAAAKAAADEVNRLAKDKQFYSDIPEQRMVMFIQDAWARLGDAASKDAVFNLAYDMAVNADPDLRAKAAAAKAAATADPKKIEGAKRAAGVNVTSTTSGQGRTLTEEEDLGAAFDRAQKR